MFILQCAHSGLPQSIASGAGSQEVSADAYKNITKASELWLPALPSVAVGAEMYVFPAGTAQKPCCKPIELNPRQYSLPYRDRNGR